MHHAPDFGLPGVTLEPGDHICGLFFGHERDELLVPFFRAGLHHGDSCVVVVDRTDPTPVVERLGTDAEVAAWTASTQLELLTGAAHCPPVDDAHRLDADDMIMLLERSLDRAHERCGDVLVRVGGEVSWWLPLATEDAIGRYEAELNHHITDRMAVLCLYDLSRFPSKAIIDAVMTHPRLLIGERVVDNPWYVSPDEFVASCDGDEGTRRRPSTHDLTDLINGVPPR